MPIYKTKEKNKDGLSKYRIKINYTKGGVNKQIMRVAYGLQQAKDLECSLLRESASYSLDSVKYEILLQDYLMAKVGQLKESTLHKTKRTNEIHILPIFGKADINKITPAQCERWKISMFEKGLSFNTLKNTFVEFSKVLNWGYKIELLNSNPLNRVGNFREIHAPRKPMNVYSPEEFQHYIAKAYQEAKMLGYYDYFIFFCLAYYTGARKGEIHALTWNDIKENRAHITKSIGQKLKGEDRLTSPKNRNSVRSVQLPSELSKVLNLHYDRCQKTKCFDKNFYICGGLKPLRDTSLQNKNKKYAAAAELKTITIHEFRHSNVSFLISEGNSIVEVARRLGHSDIKETLNTYSHFLPKDEERATASFDKIKLPI